MILETIFGFITKPLQTVLERKVKDVNLQMEIEKELKLEMMQIPFEEKKLFEQRVTTEYQHPSLLRDAVRPIITYCSWALYMYVKFATVYILSKIYFPMLLKLVNEPVDIVFQNTDKIKSLLSEFVTSIFTEYDLYVILIILGFWFGSRTLDHVIEKFAKTGGIKATIFGYKDPNNNNVYNGDV